MTTNINCIVRALAANFLLYAIVYVLALYNIPLGFVDSFLMYLFAVAYMEGAFRACIYLLVSFIISALILFGICKYLVKK